MFIIIVISKSHAHCRDLNALLFSMDPTYGAKNMVWGFRIDSGVCAGCLIRTIYGGYEPSWNRVAVPACQATWNGGIDYLESIPGLLKSPDSRGPSGL
jgi:hypothetical protein